jgi:hypothetical protein
MHTKWTVAQAKRDFEIGYLTDFSLERFALDAGAEWSVRLAGGSARGVLVDARNKEPRTFRSLDAAIAAIESIGFRVEGLGKL